MHREVFRIQWGFSGWAGKSISTARGSFQSRFCCASTRPDGLRVLGGSVGLKPLVWERFTSSEDRLQFTTPSRVHVLNREIFKVTLQRSHVLGLILHAVEIFARRPFEYRS